jgi:putative protease
MSKRITSKTKTISQPNAETTIRNMPELLAPAGSFASLQAAIKSGCNAVYFGTAHLNMRANSSQHFTLDDLASITEICHHKQVKAFLTLNTLLYDHDLPLMRKTLQVAKKSGIDAVIVSDMAAACAARDFGLEVHLSTQLSVSNIESCRVYSAFGDRVVLARELTLPMVKKLCSEIKKYNIRGPKGNLLGVEVFIHGAMCVAISGRCWMSLYTHNSSANRGACKQNCRKPYTVTDQETGKPLVIDNEYIMSPEDLCTIDFLDKLVATGAMSFKVEGRGRSPEYVSTVVKVYREALDALETGGYNQNAIKSWVKQLETVYNRGLASGYYLGRQMEQWSKQAGSKATYEKFLVGEVGNYFKKTSIAEIQITDQPLSLKDKYLISGPTTGVLEGVVLSLVNHTNDEKAPVRGDTITMPVNEAVRRGDKVYVMRKRN